MGEFDDLDPAGLSQSVEAQRARLQQEQTEAKRKKAEDATQQAQEQATTLAQAEQRTTELFEFLKKAFRGKRMSINHSLVVERRGSRPDRDGMSCVDEKPAWIVIKPTVNRRARVTAPSAAWAIQSTSLRPDAGSSRSTS